jgi:hypothetical protein
MRAVRLPADLCARAEDRFRNRFVSLEQLLEFVLSDLLREEVNQADLHEQRVVEQRLRDLGYL